MICQRLCISLAAEPELESISPDSPLKTLSKTLYFVCVTGVKFITIQEVVTKESFLLFFKLEIAINSRRYFLKVVPKLF